MLNLLKKVGAALLSLVNLVLPVFEQARSSRGLATGVRLVIGLVLFALFAAFLCWLDWNYLHLDRYLPLPGRFHFLAYYWLPILLLLVCSFAWLSYWLWVLLTTEEQLSNFPDIDRAWEAALDALDRANPGVLRELPLFLILGTPEDDEHALFHAAQVPLEVQAPDLLDAPLRLYASREALYLTCAGASALGCYAHSLVGKGPGGGGASPGRSTAEGEEEDVLATLSPGSSRRLDPKGVVEKMAQVLIQAEREGRPLTKAEKRELRAIYRQDNPNRSVLRNTDLIDEQVARLQHLCRLVVRDRHPFAPFNGILLLIPFSGLDSDADASDTAVVCQRDLTGAIAALRLHCPLVALVCDLETAPGFGDFVQGFKPRERLARLGHGCPLAPQLRSAGRPTETAQASPAARMVQSLSAWVCESVVGKWVYHAFQIEKGPQDMQALAESNAHIFLFFDEVQQRSKRLGHILSAVVAAGRSSDLLLFGGCYLAGTGTNSAQDQAFVRGVLVQRLMGGVNSVYWTEDAVAEEARLRRWTALGWSALVALAVVVVVVVGLAGWFRGWSG